MQRNEGNIYVCITSFVKLARRTVARGRLLQFQDVKVATHPILAHELTLSSLSHLKNLRKEWSDKNRKRKLLTYLDSIVMTRMCLSMFAMSARAQSGAYSVDGKVTI